MRGTIGLNGLADNSRERGWLFLFLRLGEGGRRSFQIVEDEALEQSLVDRIQLGPTLDVTEIQNNFAVADLMIEEGSADFLFRRVYEPLVRFKS